MSCEEMVLAYFKLLPQHSYGKTEELNDWHQSR